ncbi:hypothetical protein HZY88_09335 [Aerococcaceae bacterium DSM 111176]|nr:hypothetical protein [Aerococcaceae bacterium DSM 111176]
MLTKETVLQTLIENSAGLTGERASTARKAVTYLEKSNHVLDFEHDPTLDRETKKMLTVAVKLTRGIPHKDYTREELLAPAKGTKFEKMLRKQLDNRN